MIAAVILYRVVAVIVDVFLILLALGLVFWAARETVRAVLRLRAGRRKDREWFAYVAAKPRGPELLRWYRGGPEAWRHGCPRPAAPDAEQDGEPLSDDADGEAEQFAALIYAYRTEAAPEPVYDLEWDDLA